MEDDEPGFSRNTNATGILQAWRLYVRAGVAGEVDATTGPWRCVRARVRAAGAEGGGGASHQSRGCGRASHQAVGGVAGRVTRAVGTCA